jgi:hypothetical protein
MMTSIYNFSPREQATSEAKIDHLGDPNPFSIAELKLLSQPIPIPETQKEELKNTVTPISDKQETSNIQNLNPKSGNDQNSSELKKKVEAESKKSLVSEVPSYLKENAEQYMKEIYAIEDEAF